jgi:hypothetical protein
MRLARLPTSACILLTFRLGRHGPCCCQSLSFAHDPTRSQATAFSLFLNLLIGDSFN